MCEHVNIKFKENMSNLFSIKSISVLKILMSDRLYSVHSVRACTWIPPVGTSITLKHLKLIIDDNQTKTHMGCRYLCKL